MSRELLHASLEPLLSLQSFLIVIAYHMFTEKVWKAWKKDGIVGGIIPCAVEGDERDSLEPTHTALEAPSSCEQALLAPIEPGKEVNVTKEQDVFVSDV